SYMSGVQGDAVRNALRKRGSSRSAQLRPLRRQRLALHVPVDQSLALLLDHRWRGVVDEGVAGELAVALGNLDLDPLDLLVEASAFGAEVDQAVQRHQQLQVADHCGGRGGGTGGVVDE